MPTVQDVLTDPNECRFLAEDCLPPELFEGLLSRKQMLRLWDLIRILRTG